VRAYHGDFIPEKIFKRWYLPETLPDVRPARHTAPASDDKSQLAEFARRKQREKDFEEEIDRKGMAPVGSLMVAEVERRIDVFIFRCCFTHSVYEARRLVIHGDVLLNGKKVCTTPLLLVGVSHSIASTRTRIRDLHQGIWSV
jgi:ribosomal protein S4